VHTGRRPWWGRWNREAGLRVREMIRRVERDGWVWVRTTGSHRHFHHPVKPGTVTIPGSMGEDLKPRTEKSILRQAGLEDRS